MNHHISMETGSQHLDQLPELNDELNDLEIPISSQPYSDLINSQNQERLQQHLHVAQNGITGLELITGSGSEGVSDKGEDDEMEDKQHAETDNVDAAVSKPTKKSRKRKARKDSKKPSQIDLKGKAEVKGK